MSALKTAVIIPARYASTRFPGKPLIEIDGKSMIQRVHDQAAQCAGVSEVIVATDDDRIAKHVQHFGGRVQMTAVHHQSGTDRCAEVAQSIEADVVINVQGDEPFIDPTQIRDLITLFNNPSCDIATLVAPITTQQELEDANRVRVVRDIHHKALYFTRAVIPFLRNASGSNWHEKQPYFKHVGIYGFRADVLQNVSKLAPSSLEIAEGLEQLRWLENGFSIYTALTTNESPCIDTPADLDLLKKWLKNQP